MSQTKLNILWFCSSPLSDSDVGETGTWLGADNVFDSSASLIENFRPTEQIYQKQYVHVFHFETVQAILNMKDPLAIVKIDVEGAEWEVLDGLHKAIVSDRPILVLEILPVYASENHTRKRRQERIEQLVSEVHYSMLRVRKSKNESFGSLQEISAIGIHSNLHQCDYVFVPEELKGHQGLRLDRQTCNHL